MNEIEIYSSDVFMMTASAGSNDGWTEDAQMKMGMETEMECYIWVDFIE